jgi:hypothetical protein
VTLAPIAVQWDTAPPTVTTPPTLVGTTLTWAFDDPGTPSLALAVDLVDPNGVSAPQTVGLGQVAATGTMQVTIPPGTWQATLRATNSAGLTTAVPLGTITQPG